MLVVLAATVLALEAKSRLWERVVLEVAKADKVRGGGLGEGKKTVAGAFCHQQNDVSLGRNAGSLRRRCSGSHGIWRSWCGAAVRGCQAFPSLSSSF